MQRYKKTSKIETAYKSIVKLKSNKNKQIKKIKTIQTNQQIGWNSIIRVFFVNSFC